MKQTSISAFHNLNRHRVGSQLNRIQTLIESSELPLNDRRIAVKLMLPLNIVESRLCQLEREGAIINDGDKLDPATQNYSRTWKAAK
jgi:hypothetical protein